MNLTNRLANKSARRREQSTLGRFVRPCAILVFSLVALLTVTTVYAASNAKFRLRWHQLKLRHYDQEDVKTEIRFGRVVAARILATMDISDNDAANRYLNLVGQSLVIHSNRNELAFHFALLKSPSVGAYSAPGGYVFVTEGLFAILENEAELAAVLAHEIAHINLRHIVNELNIRATNKEELSNLARFLGASGDTTRAAIDQAVDKAYEVLFKNGFKKSQELQADAKAVTLMALTGYDPNALATVLHRIATLTKSDNSKTHPQSEQRNTQLMNLTTPMSSDNANFKKAAQRFLQYRGGSQTP